MLVANLNSLPRLVLVFTIGSLLAYVFGFHLLFAHTAMEAVYWGAYYFGVLLVGHFASKIFEGKDTVKVSL